MRRNLTSWDKPWLPEIDFLNSYLNLSSYHPNILELLALAHRSTKYSKYFENSEWGCLLMFQMDSDLIDAHYMKYFAGTNDTFYICAPRVPVRPDMRRKYAQMYPDTYSMIRCYVVQPGFLKRHYQFGHWQHIFLNLSVEWRIFLIADTIIAIIGIFGEYHNVRLIEFCTQGCARFAEI